MPEAAKKILVVDDDADTQELLTVILQKESFKVLCASNGWDGMAMARKEKPDLILLDILMPEMQGTDVLHALKAMDTVRAIPVIMLTAHSEKFNVLDAKYSGIADYLLKPFDNVVLLKKIRKALEIEDPPAPVMENGKADSAPPPSAAGEKPAAAVREITTQNPPARIQAPQPEETPVEDTIDPALQEKILKTQYCASEDHKMSELEPFEQLLSHELKEGMILAMPLLYANKRPFLSTGTALTEKHIEKIKEKTSELVFPVSVRKTNEQKNG